MLETLKAIRMLRMLRILRRLGDWRMIRMVRMLRMLRTPRMQGMSKIQVPTREDLSAIYYFCHHSAFVSDPHQTPISWIEFTVMDDLHDGPLVI